MKAFVAMICALFCFSTGAVTLTSVSIPVKDLTLIDLVQKSVEKFLNYEGREFVTEVNSSIVNPEILLEERDADKLLAIEIMSEVTLDVMAPEYLDVLATRSVACLTRLEVEADGSFKDAGSFCSYDPTQDDEDYYQGYDGQEL